MTYDDQLVAIAKDAPGFGGIYVDPETRQLVVWLTDVSQREVAGAKIAETFGPDRISASGTRVRLAEYGFDELKEWQTRLNGTVWSIPGVVMTGVADELNRVRIGVEHEAARDSVLAEMKAIGIPSEAVVFRTMQEPVLAADLIDKRRPTEGGLLIARDDDPDVGCTLGFVTSRSGTLGFVTNSHCTPTSWGIGGGDDTAWYQAVTSDTPKVGDETIDPGTFTGGSCTNSEGCRWSDAAFVDYDSDSDGDQGEIARTTGSGSTTIDSMNPQFHVTAEATSYAVNDRLYKIGWKTGWSSGLVTEVCNEYAPGGEDIVLLCQGEFDADVEKGDSGSPVFERPDATSNVTLHGVLWGIEPISTNVLFSSIGLVYSELGPSSTWDSCTSGC